MAEMLPPEDTRKYACHPRAEIVGYEPVPTLERAVDGSLPKHPEDARTSTTKDRTRYGAVPDLLSDQKLQGGSSRAAHPAGPTYVSSLI